jgi:hypothetical protein
MSKDLHVVICTTCWKYELRDPDPKKCGDGLREHYAVAHPAKGLERDWGMAEPWPRKPTRGLRRESPVE